MATPLVFVLTTYSGYTIWICLSIRLFLEMKCGVASAKAGTGSIVKLSDQLTNSITDLTKIIEQHKGMVG